MITFSVNVRRLLCRYDNVFIYSCPKFRVNRLPVSWPTYLWSPSFFKENRSRSILVVLCVSVNFTSRPITFYVFLLYYHCFSFCFILSFNCLQLLLFYLFCIYCFTCISIIIFQFLYFYHFLSSFLPSFSLSASLYFLLHIA